ncbi:MAG: AMP-binding protein [Actinobacteria bacterium]|nr:AMP-binding protein [Actinomycetota bacterium]
MADVVALNLPGGPTFVDAVRRCWDSGAAVLPLSPSAPAAWTATIIDALCPTHIVESDGVCRALDGGLPTENGDALIMATSGTTGSPKGVVHTMESIEFAAFASMTYLATGNDVSWLACLPLFHIGGFSVISRALVCETDLVVHPGFDATEVELAALGGVTHVSLVPTALRRIDPTLFDRILLGGSAIPADRPANSVATYGMTESGAGVIYDGLPLNGVGLTVANDGEILLNGPTMLRCYRDGRLPFDEAGWYHTGDIGTVNAQTGLLRVEGRADDLIITGGENVWPHLVEKVIETHPAIRDVAVVGRADPEWGQRVTAVIVPLDGAEVPSLEAVRDLVKAELPAWCAPKSLEVTDHIPRTALGKVQRKLL